MSLLKTVSKTVTTIPDSPFAERIDLSTVTPSATDEPESPTAKENTSFTWPFLFLLIAVFLSIGLGVLEYDRNPAGRGVVRADILPN